MGLSGLVGAGAQDALQELVAERLLQAKFEEEQRQANLRAELERTGLAQRATEHGDSVRLREQGLAQDASQFDATQRERKNDRSIDLMQFDKKAMDEDAALADISAGVANLPQHLKGVEGLVKRGAMRLGADDLEDPKIREQREIRRISAMKSPMQGSQYEKVETVDDAGNPMVQYMTPEEVRARGGVKTPPKTTAKATGPATVQAILGEIDALSQNINTGNSGPLTTIKGLFRRGAAAVNLDNEIAEYDSLVQGFTPIIARSVGHTGVLTQQDVDSVRALFPKPNDNAVLAQHKIERVRRLMEQIQQTVSENPSAPSQPPAAPTRLRFDAKGNPIP